MFSSEQSDPRLVSLDYRESKDSVLQTCWMVFAPLGLESYSMDRQTDRWINGQTLENLISRH